MVEKRRKFVKQPTAAQARGELKFGSQPLAQTRATQLEPPPTPTVRTLTIERRDISLGLGEAAGD